MKHITKAFILVLILIFVVACKKQQAAETPAATTDDTAPIAEMQEAVSVTSMHRTFFVEGQINAVRVLSEAAASAVWQYGRDFGWVDEHSPEDAFITPRHLALSQKAYNQALIQWCWENPLGLDDDDEREGIYAQVLFPGVVADKLPESDMISDWSWGASILNKADAAESFFLTASADGKTGYVIVRFIYENKNGEFEEYYLVEWAANKSGSFQYQLKGVRPMMRYLLGGIPHDMFSEKYLEGEASLAALKKLGLTHSIGYLAKWGAWGSEDLIVIKSIAPQGAKSLATYILVDDDEERIVYLGLLDEPIQDYEDRSVPWKTLTTLQAKKLLDEHLDGAELFYPGELNKLKDDAVCYGFGYNDGDNYRYAWVNSVTGELEFADEIENYTGEDEYY